MWLFLRTARCEMLARSPQFEMLVSLERRVLDCRLRFERSRLQALSQLVNHRLKLSKVSLGLAQQRFSLGGQRDMGVAALEQLEAKFTLQFGDLVTHCPFRYVQRIACRREAHLLGHDAE